MALIKCPDCGKMFSEHAECCPVCGCPTKDAKAEMEVTECQQKDDNLSNSQPQDAENTLEVHEEKHETPQPSVGSQCGKELSPENNSCANCDTGGDSCDKSETIEQATPIDILTQEMPQSSKKKSWIKWVGISSAIIVLVLACLYIWPLIFVDNKAEVKQFISELATAIDTKDKAAIENMYPDASKAESLSLTFDEKTVQIEEYEGSGSESEWIVDLGEGKDIVVIKNRVDGRFFVKESHGVFVVDADTKKFYESLGCYNSKLTDLENADRLADTLFTYQLNKKFRKTVMKNIELITFSPSVLDYVTPKATIKNKNDFDILPGSYVLNADYHCSNDGPTTFQRRDKLCYKTIPKRSQISYTFDEIFGDMAWYEFSIEFNLHDLRLLKDVYKPTGNEYSEYLKSQNAGVKDSSNEDVHAEVSSSSMETTYSTLTNSMSSNSSCRQSDASSSYVFRTAQNVIAYLSSHRFCAGRNCITFFDMCMYSNGQCVTGAVNVVAFNETQAVVVAYSIITGGRFRMEIDNRRGTLTDLNTLDVYIAKANAI